MSASRPARPTSRPTQVIAHRGASAAAPENTIDAFGLARRLGADAVELDVRRTADERLVVRHDAHLADGTVLAAVDHRDLPPDVPTLEAALDACEGMWVNVEIKNDPNDPDFDPERSLATRVADVLRERDVDDRWVVSSFDRATIDRVAAVAPGLPTAWLVYELDEAMVRGLRDDGHRAVHPWVAALTEAHVRLAHAAGLAVNTWTCNDEVRWRELVAWGVDGVCTDVPDIGRLVVGGTGPG